MNIELQSPKPAPGDTEVAETTIPVQNYWYMLLYVWGEIHLKERWRSDVESAPNLDALLATILANLVQQRLRIGLGRDYRAHAEEIAGLRGRVDFNESLKRMSFQHGRAFCHFQTFSPNVPKNQIVRSTMRRLVQTGEFGSNRKLANELQSRLRRLDREMEGADIVELRASVIQREQLNRHDNDYAVMLTICLLLHQRQMPMEDEGEAGLQSLDRDAYRLYDLYERFVAKFYAHHLKDWKVWPQKLVRWPTEETSCYVPAMKPDLTLQHKESNHLIVLDTKFTAKVLNTHYEKEIFDRNHLFQIYAYLRSQEHSSEAHRSSTGVLLYPTVNHDLSESVSIQGHAVRWETIDLASSWQRIEEELLAIPSRVVGDVPSDQLSTRSETMDHPN